jgi:GntR family transcriptional repressor for pyruvate dehydrogenase complex
MPDMYESLNHMKLYEQVVGRIEKLVIDGHLKPGDRLPAERELSDQFGVSRTVIREAVKALQEKGLVEIRPGVGTFVHDGMSEIMRQSLGRMVMIDQRRGLENLTQVREIFEPEIAALAAENATPVDIQAMQKAIAVMDASKRDVDAFITADHEFHQALANATQNKLIVGLIGSIVDLLAEQRRHIFFAGTGGADRGQEHHKRILQAVIIHDRRAARKSMIEHLQQVRSDTALGMAQNDEE